MRIDRRVRIDRRETNILIFSLLFHSFQSPCIAMQITIRSSSSFVGKGIYKIKIITKLFYAKK